MHDRTAVIPSGPPATDAATKLELKRRYPTAPDLRRAARDRIPNFAFEYADGGAGADGNINRNWSALDAVELVPRYGRVVSPPPADIELFGRKYTAPVGIAPMGGPNVVFPGADVFMATAAQRARVPYVLGIVAGIAMEQAVELAPDVIWFQLYRWAKNDHEIGFDLVRRAEACGINALVLTMDTPTRTVRPREIKSGVLNPFRLDMRLRLDALSAPRWVMSMRKHGVPRFANLAPYLPPGAGIEEMAKFAAAQSGGAFTWDEVARYRDKWKKPLVLKGIMHPADAERAVSLGVDGIVVSNHGGRQIEALPSSIDVLPAIAETVRGRLTIILDSGVRSGWDAARAVACGADAAFLGKAFLWSLGALGAKGPEHLIDILVEDVRATLGQLGCNTVAELRSLTVRHAAKYQLSDFSAA